MPPNRFESEVESFLEGSHGDRTHIKRADHHTVTPLCGTLLHVRDAGRRISRTGLDPGRRNMATLKPPTPLHAPNNAPLKPASPLCGENAPKTPFSHPQRRWWFHFHTDTSEQRRQGFQTTGPPGRQRLAATPWAAGPGCDPWAATTPPPPNFACNSIG